VSEPVLRVEGVSKTFRYRPYARGTLTLKSALIDALLLRPRPPKVTVEAVKQVSFELSSGEALGLIGPNGAGKTTLLRLVAGVYRPDSGRIKVRGRRGCMLDLAGGFHPELSGYENAEVSALVGGMTPREFQERIGEIAAFAGLEEALDAPVRTYSAGMGLRLGFAVAVALQPSLLVVDEVLAVGDQAFQERCLARVAELRASGTAMVVASHSLELVQRLCDRVAWLRAGGLVELGPAADVCEAYRRGGEA
jgi:ABC-type polysaccharide/polyol phosphate transport system ATPase subunit